MPKAICYLLLNNIIFHCFKETDTLVHNHHLDYLFVVSLIIHYIFRLVFIQLNNILFIKFLI
jgi:hypothetical protein